MSDPDYPLTILVAHNREANGKTPLAHLRSVLLCLDDPEVITRLRDGILTILSQPLAEGANREPSLSLSLYTGELSTQVRDEFSRSLRTHLFGWDSVLRLRLKLFIATFCKVSTLPH